MGRENKNDILVISLKEIFYYLFWAIMLYAKGTGLYEGMKQYNLCLVFAMACLALSLLLTRLQTAELFGMFVMAAFGGWIYYHSGDQSAIILIAVMIGLKNIPLPRIFRIGAMVFGACFVYTVLRTLLGIGDPGPILAHEKLGLGPILRWSLGYTHPNVLQITYVILSCFVLYVWNLKSGRKQGGITLCLMLGNLYVFAYSVSFTGFLFMILLLAFNLYFMGRKQFLRIEKIGLLLILPVCVAFSLVAPVFLDQDGKLFGLFNRALNTRFLATRVYLQEFGISLLGIRVPKLGSFAVDCSYTEALLSYGLLFSFLLFAGYMCTIYGMIKKNRRKELAIMLALLVAGVSEPFLFNASFKNITVLFVGKYYFECFAGSQGKEIPFLSGWDREISFSVAEVGKLWVQLRRTAERHRAVLAAVAAASFIVFGLLAGRLAQQPESIFVGIHATDCGDQETIYLDKGKLPEGFHSEIYEYTGPEEGLYEFKGNMLQVEHGRKMLSAGVWGAAGMTGVVLLMVFARKRRTCRLRGVD